MPPLPTLKVNEIFFSLEGEGLRQGEPTIFVRLSGCNLRCPFCDTKYAWEDGQPMPISAILSKIVGISRLFPTNWVSLTGGEPLLQDLRPLIRALRKGGFRIQVETNGTRHLNFRADWLSVSPKPPAYRVTADCRRQVKEVKLIVTRSLKFKILEKVRQDFPAKVPILLQPESNQDWSYRKAWRFFRQAVKMNLNNVRLSCQLHKIYGLK
ncbi:MAG: 7-carboxy-7-deazaguanine synthase QueE [Candidatus Saccharicenans sp.]|nr:MAG: radical SAM protein [Candidatus Aminicenantes bacterium]HEK85385.1 7-carboxy-7-deazaguanine synthase QueE [Candidatus Aminicenantes bacterium]